jgi:malate dehydrogenase
MAVPSRGEYDVPAGLIFSYPVTIKDRECQIVEGLEHNDFARQKLRATIDELVEERDVVTDLLS